MAKQSETLVLAVYYRAGEASGVVATRRKVSRALEILRQSQVPPVFFIKFQVTGPADDVLEPDVLATDRLRDSVIEYAQQEPELHRTHSGQVSKLIEITQADLT